MNLPCSVTADLRAYHSGRISSPRCEDCNKVLTTKELDLDGKLCFSCAHPCPDCGSAPHPESDNAYCGLCELRYAREESERENCYENAQVVLYWLARTVGYAEAA